MLSPALLIHTLPLLCKRFIIPLACMQMYVSLPHGHPLMLRKFHDNTQLFNDNTANYNYRYGILMVGTQQVGDTTYRESVHAGTGTWKEIKLAHNMIMLKNGPWCLSVSTELLMYSDDVLVMKECKMVPEQIFYVYTVWQ